MKNIQLLELFSNIDDTHIENCIKKINRSKKTHIVIRRAVGLAACVALAVCSFYFANYITNKEGSGSNLDIKSPIIEKDLDFIIENETLISYQGDANEITLPDEVNSIASYAFASSANASKITTINLNANLSSIDKNSFSGLNSLNNISVPDNNDNYVFKDNVLMATDGSVHFSVTDNGVIDVQKFVETIDSMENNVDYVGKQTEFIFDDIIVTVQNMVSEYNPTENYFVIESISAYGKSFEVDNSIYASEFSNGVIEDNAELKLLMTDEAFIYAKTRSYLGYYLIISKDGIYEYENSAEIYADSEEALNNPTWYNESVYSYGMDENGKLSYTREPRKYAFDQMLFNDVMYCVALDEFAREEGYITFKNGELIYTPEERYTVSETVNLEESFKAWLDYSEKTNEQLKGISTLEELIEYNINLYERAE